MKTVRQLLDEKGHKVWSLGPEATVFEAIKLMADKGVGALIVMQGEAPVGLISERDYARKVALEGRSSKGTKVSEVMATRVVCVRPDQSVEESMALMTDKRVRHLPVMADGQLLGIISIGDLVKTIIAEQQFIIEQLEHYITG